MQSHRELVDKDLKSEALLLNVVDTFREKKIPLDAVTMFADPSVEFGLQFANGDAAAGDGATAPAAPVVTAGEAREPPAEGGAEVVTLDRFRKK